jgi:hypothetical protein
MECRPLAESSLIFSSRGKRGGGRRRKEGRKGGWMNGWMDFFLFHLVLCILEECLNFFNKKKFWSLTFGGILDVVFIFRLHILKLLLVHLVIFECLK